MKSVNLIRNGKGVLESVEINNTLAELGERVESGRQIIEHFQPFENLIVESKIRNETKGKFEIEVEMSKFFCETNMYDPKKVSKFIREMFNLLKFKVNKEEEIVMKTKSKIVFDCVIDDNIDMVVHNKRGDRRRSKAVDCIDIRVNCSEENRENVALFIKEISEKFADIEFAKRIELRYRDQ